LPLAGEFLGDPLLRNVNKYDRDFQRIG